MDRRLPLLAFFCVLSSGCAGPSWTRRMLSGDRALHHGRYAQAEQELAAAERVAESFGADDVRRAQTLAALGDLHFAQGRYARALALYERAQPILVKAYGPTSPEAAAGLVYMGDTRAAQGNVVEAERLYRGALRAREAELPPELAARLSDL